MPKQKTHSGAKKRFGVTASGKIKFKHAKLRHILTKKAAKVKRKLRHSGIMAEGDSRHIHALLNQ